MSRTRHRITPAWAGKRCRYGVCAHRGRDHPRVGGEKLQVRPCGRVCQGSPPRGRGKACQEVPRCAVTRITPAWAGKSCQSAAESAPGWDHPRVGGEKMSRQELREKRPGSPPRGRGKGRRLCPWLRPAGITPAWAGKSCTCCCASPLAMDHPRVGGEKSRFRCLRLWDQGSPPRGRGKAPFAIAPHGIARITPAWAGKRLKRSHRSGIFISGPIPFHSVLHRPAGSGGSRAGRDGAPAGQPQNAGPA